MEPSDSALLPVIETDVRAKLGADTRFAGMVNATLGLDRNFTNFYSSLPLGKDSAITLRDPENRLLVRYPVVEAKLGQPVATSGWIRISASPPQARASPIGVFHSISHRRL